MIKFNRFYVSLLFTGLLMVYVPMTQADMQQQGYSENSAYNAPASNVDDSLQQASYGRKIGKKALSGWTNLSLGLLEIPKNIINTTNQSNFFYGISGGFIKGTVNTLGRMGVGIIDLLTFPLPTKPIAYPLFIWDNFDVDTTYGEVFRLYKTQTPTPPAALAPVAPPAPPAIAPPPKAAAADNSDQYHQETSRKLDQLFHNRMLK